MLPPFFKSDLSGAFIVFFVLSLKIVNATRLSKYYGPGCLMWMKLELWACIAPVDCCAQMSHAASDCLLVG